MTNSCENRHQVFYWVFAVFTALTLLGLLTWLLVDQKRIADENHDTLKTCNKLYNRTHTYWPYFSCITCAECPVLCDSYYCVFGKNCFNSSFCPEVCSMWRQYQVDTKEYNTLQCVDAKLRSDTADEGYKSFFIIVVLLYSFLFVGVFLYFIHLIRSRAESVENHGYRTFN